MWSCNGNVQSEVEQPKMEVVITEFFAKSLHIILESRALCVSERNVRPRDKWFNLALRHRPAALENIHLWRLEPMVVDVVLVHRPLGCISTSSTPKKGLVRHLSLKEKRPNGWSSDDFGSEIIIERWVVQYESGKGQDCSSNGKRRSGSNLLHVLYKKLILLLRSLYATVRILPAYRIFRSLNSSTQVHSFTLAHRVSSFVDPFTRTEEGEMQCFSFNPVDTSCGTLCLSVLYRKSVLDVISEPMTSMSPRLIHNYIGSPLADPLKRFPSLPVSRDSSSPLSFSNRLPQDLLRSESAPIKVFGDKPSNLHPSPSPKVAKLVSSHSDRAVDKLPSIGKDKYRKNSGISISSNDSPHISLSKNSSRCFPDDFACVFDVEYDIMDPSIRPESYDRKGHLFEPLQPGGFFPIRKSQDAAVGALVHMLKKAPPLRQDITQNAMPMQEPNKISNVVSSGFGVGKTTADAIEELKSYRDLKIMLLRQGDKSPTK